MKNIAVFSGIPRRPSVSLSYLMGRAGHRLRARLQRFVPQLLESTELWEHAAAVGHVMRYTKALNCDPAIAARASSWVKEMPPYWKVQLKEQLDYEIDNLALAFEYIENGKQFTELGSIQIKMANQMGLLLVRDNIEAALCLMEQLPDYSTTFALTDVDYRMHSTYRRHGKFRSKSMPSQLRLARQMYDRRAWWASPTY